MQTILHCLKVLFGRSYFYSKTACKKTSNFNLKYIGSKKVGLCADNDNNKWNP